MKGECLPTQISDIKKLDLPNDLENKIREIINHNHMQYEVWIESAPTYLELIKSLKKRNYKNIPPSSKPMLWYSIENKGRQKYVANQIKLNKLNKKIMLQKRK